MQDAMMKLKHFIDGNFLFMYICMQVISLERNCTKHIFIYCLDCVPRKLDKISIETRYDSELMI